MTTLLGHHESVFIVLFYLQNEETFKDNAQVDFFIPLQMAAVSFYIHIYYFIY